LSLNPGYHSNGSKIPPGAELPIFYPQTVNFLLGANKYGGAKALLKLWLTGLEV